MKKIKTLKGGVTIWNGRSLLNPNGGRINLQFMVEHIPVVPNVKGLEDFYQLARVLRAQGLSLQAATDSEGHVCIYTNLNRLCYQARGANSISCGVEHMHMSTNEKWTKRQLRASAWLWVYAERTYGLPTQRGRGRRGLGNTVICTRKGHVGHRWVSEKAGYYDRSDPGPNYDWGYVKHCVKYFNRHGHFEGA
jgi:hypothetical protein